MTTTKISNNNVYHLNCYKLLVNDYIQYYYHTLEVGVGICTIFNTHQDEFDLVVIL